MLSTVVLVFQVLVVYFDNSSSQPITDNIDNGRQSRQLDFGDCCPCPSKSSGRFDNRDQITWPAPTALQPASQRTGEFSSRAEAIDDCPCRARGADSEGASSIFFPTATRAFDSFVKPTDQKEDPKNLLEPEVGLASSVLETLREATEEEYRDAVARDAARARTVEDVTPEESGRSIVTIIVSPKHADDIYNDDIPEASHVQEARCIHPLGGSLGKMRYAAPTSANLLTDIFRLPKRPSGSFHGNLLDMDSNVGASNIHERVMEDNKEMHGLRVNPSLLQYNAVDDCDIRKTSPLSKLKESLKQLNNLHFIKNNTSIVPKIRLNNQSQRVNLEVARNNDLNPASSNVEKVSERQSPLLKLKTLLPIESSGETQNPVSNIKNFFKLKDVEFISPTKYKETDKNDLTKLKLPSLFDGNSKNRLTDLNAFLRHGIPISFKHNTNNRIGCEEKPEVHPDINMQIIPHQKTAHTEIVETVPNTSSIIEIKDNCNSQNLRKGSSSTTLEKNLNTNTQTIPGNDAIRTDILDTVPNPSENVPVILHNDSDESDTIQSINDQQADKSVCKVSENMEETESPGNQDKIESDMDVNVSVIDPTEDDHTIISNDDYEMNSSNDANLANIRCLEHVDENNDTILDNNDNNVQEEFKNIKSEVDSIEEPKNFNDDKRENLRENNANNFNPKVKSIQNRKILSSLTESVSKKLENLRRASKLNKNDPSRRTQGKTSNQFDEPVQPTSDAPEVDCQNDGSDNIMAKIPSELFKNDFVENKRTKSSNPVSINDLQNLSDSLLKKSAATDKTVLSTKDIEHTHEKSAEIKDFNDEMENDKLLKYTNQLECDKEIQTAPVDNISSTRNDNAKEHSDNELENPIRNSVINDVESERTTLKENESKYTNGDHTEMAADASDPIISTIQRDPLNIFRNTHFRSPFLQDIIVQPTSLFSNDLNIFDKTSLDPIASLNLPFLNDLRERLANIFGGQEITSNEELTECQTENPIMSAKESNSNFKFKSPLEPTEDIDLNIFQIRPLPKLQSNHLPELPKLNLKSYKAKLPIPKSLELKPMKLESTIGNKGGLLGATITVGPESKAVSKPLGHLPSLEETRENLRLNAEHLLSSPLDINGHLFPNNLRLLQTKNSLSDDLKSRAENTLRDIKERIEFSVNGIKTDDKLGSPLIMPQELLGKIVDARDDLNDKLKGLHYDLNDRLTSIHDNMFDQARLMSLNNPDTQRKKSVGYKSFTRELQRSSVPTSQRLALDDRKKTQNKFASDRNKLNQQRNVKLGLPQARNNKDPNKLKGYKMSALASVPVPKSVEAPKIKSNSTKSLTSQLDRDSKSNDMANNSELRRLFNTQFSNVARQPLKSSGQTRPMLNKEINKTKVTFTSTTSSPITTSNMNEFTTLSPIKRHKVNLRTPSNKLDKMQSKMFADRKKSRSEVKPDSLDTLVPFPVQPKFAALDDEDLDTNKDVPQLNRFQSKSSPKSSILEDSDKSTIKSKTKEISSKPREASENNLYKRKSLPPIVWPKITESSFLSKVRDAVQARLTNIDSMKKTDDDDIITAENNNNRKPRPNSDMERSASENSNIVVKEPLKENISYKCKMVCTQET